MTPVTVSHVISEVTNEAAGTTSWLRRLLAELPAHGIDAEVLTLGTAPASIAQPVRVFPRDRALPGIGRLLPSRALRRATFAAAEAGHVLHASGLWRMPNIYPGRAAEATGAPLVVSPHGMLGTAALRYSRHSKRLFAKLYQRRALAPVTCFHATSEKEVADIRAWGLEAPVALIPIGIDVPDPAQKGSTEIRRVMYLGRLHPQKGVDRLIAAWSRLERGLPGWELQIVGPSEGGQREALKRLAAQENLGRVRFDDGLFGAAKLDAYRAADIVVLPTLEENFGLVVVEALAAGTPVICTKGAPWRGLETQGCGWWIEHGVGPLVAALEQATALSRTDLNRMGARGRRWMVRDFAWSRVGADMAALYRWCRDGGPAPGFVDNAAGAPARREGRRS